MKKPNILLIFLIIFALGYLFFYLFTLTKFPKTVTDEGWQISSAFNFLKTGDNSSPLLYPFLKPDLARPFTSDLFYALFFKILNPSLFSGRFLVFIFFLAILFLTYLISKKLYDQKIGLLAVILFALSPFVFETRYIRNDLFLAFFVLLSFFFLIKYLKEKKLVFSFLAGFLIFFAYDIHQNALFFIFAFLFFFIFQNGFLAFFKDKGFWFFLLGSFLPIIFYFFIHIFSNPKIYYETVKFSLSADHPGPLFSENLKDIFLKEFKRYLFYFYPLSVLEGILLFQGLVFGFLRRKKEDLTLLLFILIPLFLFFLFSANKSFYYLWPIFPLLYILTSKMFVDVISQNQETLKIFAIFIFSFFILFNLIHIGRDFLRTKDCDYQKITDKVEEIVPKDKKIMAMPRYMLGLVDEGYDFKSIQILSLYKAKGGKTFFEALLIEKPDYLLYDEELEHFIREADLPEEKQHGFSGLYFFSPSDFWGFLEEKGEIVSEFQIDCYYLKIYKIHHE